jgi:glycosyltransferase involved in cell wall biosynthesis
VTTKDAVVHAVEMVKPGGGPSGYVFNLHQALKDRALLGGRIDTYFQGSSTDRVTGFGEVSTVRKIHGYLPFVGSNLTLRLLTSRQIRLYWKKPLERQVIEALQPYKVVVFHSVRMAARYAASVPKNGQQIHVMLHPPTNLATEIVENWQGRYGQSSYAHEAIRRMAQLELDTYLASNGVLTMTKAGLHAYFDFDPKMREAFMNRATFHEIPSGVPALVPTKSRQQMRTETGVPKDAFIAGFFGRFHPHKGFDLFLDAVRKANERKLPVHFVCAGSGSIEPPKDLPNLTNLGWRKDIAEVVNMVDLVVVPNRVAALDFLSLEAMSIGKPILASGIGGNVYLASTTEGVHLFDPITADGIVAAIQKFTPAEALRLGQINREVYQRTYNVDAFIKRHMELTECLLAK